MQGFPWVQTLVGWVHITSAAAVAGFLFVWLANAAGNRDAARSVARKYLPVFRLAAILLPITGSYTWYIRTGQNYPDFYFHTIFTKIVLYVVLFGLAEMLMSRKRPDRDRRGMLLVAVAVTLVILFLSAFMRRVSPQVDADQADLGTGSVGRVVVQRGVASGWPS